MLWLLIIQFLNFIFWVGWGWKMIVGIIMRKDIALHAPLWTYTEGVFLKWWKSKLHCIWWFCCSQWHTHTHSLLRLIHCQNVSGVTFILLLFKTEYSSDIMANGKLFKLMKHSDLYIYYISVYRGLISFWLLFLFMFSWLYNVFILMFSLWINAIWN